MYHVKEYNAINMTLYSFTRQYEEACRLVTKASSSEPYGISVA